MSYGLWLSTGGLQVNEYRRSVMANNLANASTVGFKHDLAVVQERPVESRAEVANRRFSHPVLDDITGGMWVTPTVQTFKQGELERTDAPLDVAIQGDGFFVVQDGDAERYTRDGRMTLNPQGELVMAAGGGRARVLDSSGQPIRIDPSEAGTVEITRDGTVVQGEDPIARIGLVDFEDRTKLTKVGTSLYQNHGAAKTTAAGSFRSGHVERSTSDPIRGLAAMIEVSRAYQLNANLLSLQDQTIGQAVSRVGRIG